MAAKRYETRSPEDRARRRAETAAMTKCWCGNVARRGEVFCGRHDPEGDPFARDDGDLVREDDIA